MAQVNRIPKKCFDDWIKMLRIHEDFVYKMLRLLQPHDLNLFSTFKYLVNKEKRRQQVVRNLIKSCGSKVFFKRTSWRGFWFYIIDMIDDLFFLVHSFNANNLIKVRLGSCQTYTKAQQKKIFFFFVHFLAGINKVILNKKKKMFPLHFLFQSVFQLLCILKIFLSKREQGRRKDSIHI